MRAAAIVTASLSAGLAAAQTQPAAVITNNPTNVVYEATLPQDAFFTKGALNGNVKGSITAQAPEDGVGVKFKVRFENIPKEGGPFLYHIHVNPVVDGNCTKTLAHLDPTNRGEQPPCDASQPQTCQVGDLSGKHGKVTQDPFEAEYVDPFISTKEGDPAFFGNRSFVFHFANTTRITCANFQKAESSSQPSPAGGSSCSPRNAAGAPMGTGSVQGSKDTTVPFVASATVARLSLPLTLVSTAVLAALAL